CDGCATCCSSALRALNLPLLDEPMSPSRGEYTQPHTKAWSAKIDSFDAFVFVTPECNRGPPGALKNAIDFLYREWNNKAAAFVSYGGASRTRAVQQPRPVQGAAARAVSNSGGWSWARCRSRTCAPKSRSPWLPIFRMTLPSSPLHATMRSSA